MLLLPKDIRLPLGDDCRQFSTKVLLQEGILLRNMDRIAGELSPENLHCDGEISGAQAAAKARELNNIRAALEHYCLNNWLDTPECIY